jgi:hypothetical protein
MKEGGAGASRLEVVKEVLPDILDKVSSKKGFNVGLRTYGKKGSAEKDPCGKSDILVSIQKVEKGNFGRRLGSIEAVGKAPLAYALSQAATDFKDRKGTNHVILLACGPDSCGGDPCREAAELAKPPISARIHVIRLVPAEAASQTFACIAQKGGGLLLTAADKLELGQGVEKVLKAALPANFELTVLGASEKPIEAQIRVFPVGQENYTVDSWTQAGIFKASLVPGVYNVSIAVPSIGKTEMLKGIQIQAEKMTRRIYRFQIARIALAAKDAAGEPAAPFFTIYKAGTEEVVTSSSRSTAGFAREFEPGKYDIKASDPDTGIELWARNQEVKNGMRLSQTFDFSYGELLADCLEPSGEPLSCSCRIFQADTEKLVVEGSGCEAGFLQKLVAGVYDVQCKEPGRGREARLKGIEIKAGEKTEKVFFFE